MADGGPNVEYSPSELCEWFGIPRTTLFRWEALGEIPPTERDERGRTGRRYRRAHVDRVAELVRAKIRDEMNLAVRQDRGPLPDLLERLHRCEYFARSPEEGLRQLQG